MSSPSISATIVFAIFAFGFIGLMLVGAFVIDRRRVKDVHEAIPERSEGAFDQHQRTDGSPTGRIDDSGVGEDARDDSLGRSMHGRVHEERPVDGSAGDAGRRGQ